MLDKLECHSLGPEARSVCIDRTADQLENFAEELGCSIGITVDDELFHVYDLARLNLKDPSTKGNGMKLLSAVCDKADRLGISIDIEHMTDESKLGELYSSLGFVVYDRSIAGITSMTRKPKTYHRQE